MDQGSGAIAGVRAGEVDVRAGLQQRVRRRGVARGAGVREGGVAGGAVADGHLTVDVRSAIEEGAHSIAFLGA